MRELDQRTEGGCRPVSAARMGRAAPQGRTPGVVLSFPGPGAEGLQAWGGVSERVPGLCSQPQSLVLLRFIFITLITSLQLKCLLPSLSFKRFSLFTLCVYSLHSAFGSFGI